MSRLTNYYDYLPDSAKCKLCTPDFVVSRSNGSTTAMKKHLAASHPDENAQFLAKKEKSPSTSNSIKRYAVELPRVESSVSVPEKQMKIGKALSMLFLFHKMISTTD